MREILQFSTTKERLKYLSGGFEEIIPVEVAEKGEIEPKEVEKEKKSPKKASKGKKKSKKGKEDGKVQAE